MIEIDGAYGEGGGQIIRTSLTLSAITRKPVHITNIRANRPEPGLRPQHLTACKAVRNVCRGTLGHAEVGSTELTFEPGPIVGGRYEFDIGTAGSVTLVAQTLIPILLKASKESELRIIGGTHVMKSPGYDYFEHVFLAAIKSFGADAVSRMLRPGYYPRGGGIIEIDVKPSELQGKEEWKNDDEIHAIFRVSGLPESIAIREKKIFVANNCGRTFIRQDEADSVGNAVTAWMGLRGSYFLGEKGKRAEAVAQEAYDELLKEKGFDIDMHLADQLLVYAAISNGRTRYSTSRVSDHLRTNASVISRFLDKRIEIGDGIVSIG